MKRDKQGFRINAGRPSAVASMLAFALSIPLLILGYADRLHDPAVCVKLVFLPALSAFLMIVVILSFGQKAPWLSIFPVFVGILGFVFKLTMDPRGVSLLHHSSAIVLYFLIVVLWTLTVLYVIKTKWLLVILFLLPFLKHLLVNDIPVLIGAAAPVPVSTWLKEGSMLSLMLALSCCALSFEKNDPNT